MLQGTGRALLTGQREPVLSDYIETVIAPLVWFKFMETAGTTAANSGSVALSGTYGGGVTLAQPAPTPEIRALLFDGSDDFVSFPSNASVNALAAGTWGFLVNPSSLGENSEGHIHAFATNEILRLGSGVLVGNLDGTTGDGLTITTSGLTLSTWAWVFTTYDFAGDDKLHIYRNGVELGTSTFTAATGDHATLAVTHFLGNNAGGTRTFAGLYASPFLVGRVLTTTEMLQIVARSGI